MAGNGPPCTPFPRARSQVVDRGPSPAMTIGARTRATWRHDRLPDARDAVWRHASRRRPDAVSPLGARAGNRLARIRRRRPAADAAVPGRMVRSNRPLPSRHALSLSPGGRHAGARPCFALPAGGRARPLFGGRSAVLSVAKYRVARPALARDRALRTACRIARRLHRRGARADAAARARHHRRRADAGERFPGPPQLGL